LICGRFWLPRLGSGKFIRYLKARQEGSIGP